MTDDVVFQQFKLGNMANFQYIFGSRRAGTAAIVDPGFEPKTLRRAAEALGLTPTHILVTHGHSDHVGGLAELRRWTKAQVVAHPESAHDPDIMARDGQKITVAGVPVTCFHAPGHAADMVNYIVDDARLLTGDTLFIEECGRADLPGSDVKEMWRTLNHRYARLPDHLVVCPGHDYGPVPARALGEEKRLNPCLRPRELGEFIKFMAKP